MSPSRRFGEPRRLRGSRSLVLARRGMIGTGQLFPATGQMTCWNSAGVVACAGTGHDGEVQAGATPAYCGTTATARSPT
jgi:hypothetical protein